MKARRSNSSYEHRQQLKAYARFPPVVKSISFDKYLQFLKHIVEEAHLAYEKRELSDAYITYVKFTQFFLSLQSHPEFKSSKYAKFVGQYSQAAKVALEHIENIAQAMDEEEDLRIRNKENEDLADMFDEEESSEIVSLSVNSDLWTEKNPLIPFNDSAPPNEGVDDLWKSLKTLTFQQQQQLNENAINPPICDVWLPSDHLDPSGATTPLAPSAPSVPCLPPALASAMPLEPLPATPPVDLISPTAAEVLGPPMRASSLKQPPASSTPPQSSHTVVPFIAPPQPSSSQQRMPPAPEISYDKYIGVNIWDAEIVRALVHCRYQNRFPCPPPSLVTITLKIASRQYRLLKHDFHVSFVPFMPNLPPELQMSRSALETNRCFFLHLGIAMQIHPFILEIVFRQLAAMRLSKCAADDFIRDLLVSVNEYSGFVDANSLCFIWPKEFNGARICIISGSLNSPMFSCFYSKQHSVNRDIIVHCSGSHFTLLASGVINDQILPRMLDDARNAGLVVQMNELDGDIINQNQPSIASTISRLLS